MGTKESFFTKRKIPPYENKWALPGLRMFKPESIDDTIRRIVKHEVGVNVESSDKTFLGQYVARFRTEHNRQDLSTGYYLKVQDDQEITINTDHFSSFVVSKKIPANTGSMYKFYF